MIGLDSSSRRLFFLLQQQPLHHGRDRIYLPPVSRSALKLAKLLEMAENEEQRKVLFEMAFSLNVRFASYGEPRLTEACIAAAAGIGRNIMGGKGSIQLEKMRVANMSLNESAVVVAVTIKMALVSVNDEKETIRFYSSREKFLRLSFDSAFQASRKFPS